MRTGACFGPWDEINFVTRALRLLAVGRRVYAPHHVVSPTYVPALVDVALELLRSGEEGVWHLSNQHAISWSGLARLVAETAGFSSSLVHECPPASIGWMAARPAYSALASRRGALLPKMEDSLERYFEARNFGMLRNGIGGGRS